MSNRFFSYHNTACKLIASYRKEMPLQHFLRKYFAENKKHGSKDRKWIAHFCYSFYRLGKSLSDMDIETRLPIAVYLCTDDVSVLGDYFPIGWPQNENLEDKILYVQQQFGFRLEDIFPFPELLLPEIDFLQFNKSFLRQPDVFLRIRPGKEDKVLNALEIANIDFEQYGNSLRLHGRASIDQVLEINKDVVVQDLNSQKIASLFPQKDVHNIWDCCAASGGKTLLLRDSYPKAKIVVSDIRASILQNHKKRMQEAGVAVQKYLLADLTQPIADMSEKFDLIVCDAPCSGSGTWSRVPEEMYFFEKNSLKNLNEVQLKIVSRTFVLLKEGGYLLYITCSSFLEEDDHIMKSIINTFGLSLESKQIFSGMENRSDTMYACLFRRNGIVV